MDCQDTKDQIKITYADKGYAGAPNREFLALNNIRDGRASLMTDSEMNSILSEEASLVV